MTSPTTNTKTPSAALVLFAFIAVYLVWGSTYFFIRRALAGFPPMILGMLRFVAAGLIMMGWALAKEKSLFDRRAIVSGIITGFLILFIGNGMVIFMEQYVPSAWVAIIVSAAPVWFVLFDKPHWSENFRSKSILAGLGLGLVGIFLLYAENLRGGSEKGYPAYALAGLVVGSMCWVGGSLLSKYRKPTFPAAVNSTWQMLFAGVYFGICAALRGEYSNFHFASVSADAWTAIIYLVLFGSMLGYSCYIWLVQVQPPAKVSTYAYVNPVVAVILGVFFANEHISVMQIVGLSIILLSVLLINLNKYIKQTPGEAPAPAKGRLATAGER